MTVWLFCIAFSMAFYIFRKYSYSKNSSLIGDYHKKAVFVTGCDSGFGNALAKKLDSLGVQVFATCLSKEGAQELSTATSENLKTIMLDLTFPEQIQQAYQTVMENIEPGRKLWGIVNNAGIQGPFSPVQFLTRKDYMKVMDVNYFGLVDLCTRFLSELKKNKGRIVNTSSGAGLVAGPLGSPYSPSKFAVEGFTDGLRREMKMWGVEVVTVEPGCFKTGLFDPEMFKRMRRHQWDSLPESLRKEYGESFLDELIRRHLELVGGHASTDIGRVADAYVQALFARRPKIVYPVGGDAVFCRILSSLPSVFCDLVFQYMMGPPIPEVLKHETPMSEALKHETTHARGGIT